MNREQRNIQNNIRDAFPKTPQFISEMVQNRVREQLDEKIISMSRRRNLIKAAIAVLICFFSVSGTAYAVSKLWNMQIEKVDKYAVKAEIVGTTESSETKEGKLYTFESDYLPEYLKWKDVGTSSIIYLEYGVDGSAEGASLCFTEVDSDTEWIDIGVEEYEEITINEHQAICVDIEGNRTIYYVLFEKEQLLMTLWNFDIPTEEITKIMSHISLQETIDSNAANLVILNTWVMGNKQSGSTTTEDIAGGVYKKYDFTTYTCSKEDMKNLHEIGESFLVSGVVDAKVTNVIVTDSMDILNKEGEYYNRNAVHPEFDDQGKIKNQTIQYIKSGNGMNTLNEVVYEEEVPMKLVYIEVEYINTSEWELEDIKIPSRIVVAQENGNKYQLKTWEREDLDYNNILASFSLEYEVPLDFYNGENWQDIKKGTIQELGVGESCTVYWAYAIAEEDLPYMYLDLKNYYDNSAIKGLNKEALELGLVDIRQK